MEQKKKREPMPETMFSETVAEKMRDSIHDALCDLHFAVLDIRRAGVPIESVKDIKEVTRESIKAQLKKDKEAYFKNMRYVPSGLRRQVNQEFDEMESTLLPLADNLVKALKRIPLSFKVNVKAEYKTGEYCIKCDDKELEEYIHKAATTNILPEYREYYESLSAFCESWNKLQEDAERLHIVKPKGLLIEALMDATPIIGKDGNIMNVFGYAEEMGITPEKMYGLICNSKIIRML